MAPSTRAKSRVEKAEKPASTRTKKNARARPGTLQRRLLAELHTEGTGLKGDFPEKRPAVYHRGAWYEAEEAAQEPPREEARKRRQASDGRQEPERASKRTRRVSQKVRENNADRRVPSSSKTATEDSNASLDEAFLQNTAAQLRASKAARRSIRRHDIERMLPFLDAMAVPVSERVPQRVRSEDQADSEAADMYLLDKREARGLLNSNEQIEIPVFVPDGAQQLFDPEIDGRRPIEQVFDYFHNPTETDETIDNSRRFGTGNDLREITLPELRERFLGPDSGAREYPFNFPDIPNPLLAIGIPYFMQHGRCGLLKTLVRNMLPVDPRNVCPEKCPQANHASLRCGRHRLSAPELIHLQSGWLHWQSTMMLAEPGAFTHAHWDKWGFGTWIACHEGEIAFAWLSRPTDDIRTRWLTDGNTVEGRWVFVVLRPGDALYMPNGTVHLVFRQPEGGPTLGLAGHVVRGPDVAAWLRALRWEVEDEIRNPDVSIPYGDVVSCLVAGMKAMVDRDDMSEREIEEYGGQQNLDEARSLLDDIENLVNDL